MTRIEHDALGPVEIDDTHLWGPQTQRSLEHFKISTETIPLPYITALAQIKKAAAIVNQQEHKLSDERQQAICQAADAIIAGQHDNEFPLSVWQTGSGTQSNMNVNEVIAHLCNQTHADWIHPNDHVNLSQSSNDTFPTAMHLAIVEAISTELLPECQKWATLLQKKTSDYAALIKIGRTHLQDATPLSFGQEVSGWAGMLINNIQFIDQAQDAVRNLAIGGTAVGTGMNASPTFGTAMAEQLSRQYQLSFTSDPNKFYALTSHSAISYLHGALRALAGDLLKIANDIRWLSSGPRCGLGEITIPANEPGSSIMPGKVNPTQCEALTMLAVQVMGNDTTIQVAASQGNFELNVFKPVIAYNVMQSIQLLTDGLRSFRLNCLVGLTPNVEKMATLCENSLMLVTALSPHIGYEQSAKIAQAALANQQTLKEATLELTDITEADFDLWVNPQNMI